MWSFSVVSVLKAVLHGLGCSMLVSPTGWPKTFNSMPAPILASPAPRRISTHSGVSPGDFRLGTNGRTRHLTPPRRSPQAVAQRQRHGESPRGASVDPSAAEPQFLAEAPGLFGARIPGGRRLHGPGKLGHRPGGRFALRLDR